MRHIFADRVYRGDKLRNAIAEFGRWMIEIVTRSERVGTFKPEPKRWVIERTLERSGAALAGRYLGLPPVCQCAIGFSARRRCVYGR